MIRTQFLLLAILFFTPLFLQGQQEGIPKVVTLEIGAHMPDFLLPGVDDKMYTPEDFKDNKLLVVIFTCNHCPTAQAYEQRIISLYNEFKRNGVGFVAISPNSNDALSLAECGYTDLDDSYESMKIRAKDINLDFPYLFDGETSEISVKFGPVATPHVFIFDGERKLRYRGRIDDMESPYEVPTSVDTHDAIVALLNGEKVQKETTKTFGCSVKWPWKNEWTKQLIKNWAEEEVVLEDASKETLDSVLQNEGENLRLINVWATYCGPCVMEFPDLVETYRMYSGRGLDFISVSMDRPKSRERVQNFLIEQQASGLNYIWTGGTSYEAVEIINPDWQGSLPYTLLVKPGGEVLFKYEGPVDILALRKAIIDYLGKYFADD
jgi:peroxiredoxin